MKEKDAPVRATEPDDVDWRAGEADGGVEVGDDDVNERLERRGRVGPAGALNLVAALHGAGRAGVGLACSGGQWEMRRRGARRRDVRGAKAGEARAVPARRAKETKVRANMVDEWRVGGWPATKSEDGRLDERMRDEVDEDGGVYICIPAGKGTVGSLLLFVALLVLDLE